MHGPRARPAIDERQDATPLQERLGGVFLVAMVSPAFVLAPIRLGLRPLVAVALLVGVAAGVLAWLLHAPTPAAWRQRCAVLRLRPPRAGAGLVAAAVLAGMATVVALTIAYAHLVHQPMGSAPPWAEYVRRGWAYRLVGAVAVVAVAPVDEELAFRGVLLTRLEARFGAPRAVVGAAALFAVVHGEPWAMPVQFAVGALCGALAWSSDSVWPGVLLHAAWNGFGYFDPLTRLAPRWSEGPRAVAAAAVVLACSAAAAGAAMARLRSRSRDAREWRTDVG